jgi:myo-inositol-1(or 4)-monophosphatase
VIAETLRENLRELTAEVEVIARSAASFILSEKKGFTPGRVEVKGLNDFVSYVDKGSERIIVDGLGKLLPDAGFIAEEGTVGRSEARHRWVIDPLDGTTNFIHGMPFFAVSIALLDGDMPVLGVVYEMNRDEMFTAWKGGGAWLNGAPIRVSSTPNVASSLIGTGFPYYDYHLLDGYLALFRHLMQFSRGLRRPGSAATDLAYVACGRFDAFYEYSLSPWDVAAGIILVQEAGGMVSDFSSGNDFLFGKEIIACNPLVMAEMQGLVARFMARP